MIDFANLMEPTVRFLKGEPNKALSTRDELRFGTRGSLSVKIGGQHKGTWADHERGDGGGVLEFVMRERGGSKDEALHWLKETFPQFVEDLRPAPGGRSIAAVYPYQDEAGATLFEVVRHEPKDFRQRQPDGKGGHIWNLKGVRQVPYRLPELIEALAAERVVFIVEGEKDVERLAKLNITATCNAGGAGKWRDDFAAVFEGSDVVVIPDNDEPGREHAEKVARSLKGVAARVRLLDLPGLPRKGDVSDWLDGGGSAETLHKLADAAPDWRPTVASRLPAVWWGEEDREPPLAWLVKGLLIDGGFSTVYGPPGSSKSFLVLDLALHIAHGRAWFGHSVMGGGVVYVSGEGGAGMRQRMRAWRQEKTGEAGKPFVLIPASVNLFDDEDGAETLIADVKAHQERMGEPLRLVVLDTLSRMIGSGDEDRARDINVVVQRAERIQRELGCHVLVVHHSGKDRDRGARGSNALIGAVDAAIEIARHETGLCEGKIAKVKDGGDTAPFTYELLQSVLGIDEEGDDITSCVVKPADASTGSGKGEARLSEVERIMLDALREATVEHGRPAPDGHNLPSGHVVTVDQWRAAAYRRGISQGDAAAKRQAFHRGQKRLADRGLVIISEGFVCLASSA